MQRKVRHNGRQLMLLCKCEQASLIRPVDRKRGSLCRYCKIDRHGPLAAELAPVRCYFPL